MKILTLLPILCLALFASSCRTTVPLDPTTMKPSCECLPENMTPHQPCGSAEPAVQATK